VDDGSTDGTLAVARQFESETVRVVTQKNQGAAATRNAAFSLCKGDYIQYLDADDLMGPEKIASQMEALGQSPDKRTLLSGSWGNFMYRYYRTKFIPSAVWCDLSPVEWLLRKMRLNLYMQTASWLVSRELAEAADPAKRRAELIDEYTERYANPYIAAERGYIDDVISPADTRAVICRSLDILASKREELPRRKHGNVPL